MRKEITKKDLEVLEFIKRYMKINGTTPTIREIMEGMGYYSTLSVQYHFKKLVEEGYITQKSSGAYGYTVKGMKYVEETM